MGEFLVFCNWCVMGAAGYAGVQVGRLQRAIAAETQALEDEEEQAADAEEAAEAAEEEAALGRGGTAATRTDSMQRRQGLRGV